MTAIAELSPTLTPEKSLPKDPRLMGAMLFILQEEAGKLQVLINPDESKSEISAGLTASTFTPPGQNRWSVIAGGAQIHPKKETVADTLQREIVEELEVLLGEIPAMSKTVIESWAMADFIGQTHHPFLVGQLKYNKQQSLQAIHEVSGTAAYVEWDCLPIELRNELGWVGEWVDLQDLAKMFDEIARTGNTDIKLEGKYLMRPQTFTAAKILFEQLVKRRNPQLLDAEIQRLNRIMKRRLIHESKKLGVPVRNGVTDKWGMVKETLPESEKIFLGVQKPQLTSR